MKAASGNEVRIQSSPPVSDPQRSFFMADRIFHKKVGVAIHPFSFYHWGQCILAENVIYDKIFKSKPQWRLELTPEQYRVCREKGTERAFSGAYWKHIEKGRYGCICCDNVLFSSETKFDSGSGWPSFWAPIDVQNVTAEVDNRHNMRRMEIRCGRCDAHLGHVFADGPKPSGLRYCINSVALQFQGDQTSPFQKMLNATLNGADI